MFNIGANGSCVVNTENPTIHAIAIKFNNDISNLLVPNQILGKFLITAKRFNRLKTYPESFR